MESKSEVKEYIARRIRELRESRKWNQEDLGKKFTPEKKKATVSSWENGRTTPDADTLIELCRIFEVDISDFYPGDSGKLKYSVVSLSDDEERLVRWYRASSSEGKSAIYATAEKMFEISI